MELKTYQPKASTVQAVRFTPELAHRAIARHAAGETPSLPPGMQYTEGAGFVLESPGGREPIKPRFGDYVLSDGRVLPAADFEEAYELAEKLGTPAVYEELDRLREELAAALAALLIHAPKQGEMTRAELVTALGAANAQLARYSAERAALVPMPDPATPGRSRS